MGKELFDDDDASNDDLSNIQIDEGYARRFEHNKKREDLQRYDELKKKGKIGESDNESDSESSSEEEEEEVIKGVVGSKKTELKFFDALIKVRNQDPSLKKDDVKLFESDDDDDDDQEGEPKVEKKKKAIYLKDALANQLIEEGPEYDEDDSDDEQELKKKSYSEEQEELKKALLDAVGEIDDDDEEEEFVKVKKSKNEDEEENEPGDGELANKVDEYFGRDAEMDPNQDFLKQYFVKKMWLEKESTGDLMVDEEVDELLNDEEEIERQEGYELGYNFRHEEENAGDRIVGFSRKVEGSVRKKENPRKEQRKRKEERMMIADMERKEELKHLKNLNKEEMKGKLHKVMEIAGIKERLFGTKDLEKEFDPDEYDTMMKAVFDDQYYAADDEEFGSDHDENEKPDFDKEDELLGLAKDWDVLESGDGFLAARERILLKNKSESFVDDHDNAIEEEDEQKMSIILQKAKEDMMEEFYKLDYEDTIGDLKTRFKYAKIKPNKFGLKTEEMLMMDDKDLNQYVSLKKIAPYREKEWKVPDSKRYQIKQQQQLALGQKPDEHKGGKKRKHLSTSGDKTTQFEVPSQSKKKRRQHLKVSTDRRIAYGNVPSRPKKNKNK